MSLSKINFAYVAYFMFTVFRVNFVLKALKFSTFNFCIIKMNNLYFLLTYSPIYLDRCPKMWVHNDCFSFL